MEEEDKEEKSPEKEDQEEEEEGDAGAEADGDGEEKEGSPEAVNGDGEEENGEGEQELEVEDEVEEDWVTLKSVFYTVTHIIKAEPVPAVEHSWNKAAYSTDYIKWHRYLLEVVIVTFKFSLKQVSFQ